MQKLERSLTDRAGEQGQQFPFHLEEAISET
jgi:hypothetical protein